MKSQMGCPFCRQHLITLVPSTPPAPKGYQAECDHCGARGPIFTNRKDAMMGWELGLESKTGWLRQINIPPPA